MADVGVDDEVGSGGSVVFQIFVDDIKVYDSGVMTGATATKSVSIDVTGHSKMQLVVTDARERHGQRPRGLGERRGWWRWRSGSSTATTTAPVMTSVDPFVVPVAMAPVTTSTRRRRRRRRRRR